MLIRRHLRDRLELQSLDDRILPTVRLLTGLGTVVGGASNFGPSISADGKTVAFLSDPAFLADPGAGRYLHQAGAGQHTALEVLDRSSGTIRKVGEYGGTTVRLSGDARTALVIDDNGGFGVVDLASGQSGPAPMNADGSQLPLPASANDPGYYIAVNRDPLISDDGRTIGFIRSAGYYAKYGFTIQGSSDSYLLDRPTGIATLVIAPDGARGSIVSVGRDGRSVVYQTATSTWLRDLPTQTDHQIDPNAVDAYATRNYFASDDGQAIVTVARHENIVSLAFDNRHDVFLKDPQADLNADVHGIRRAVGAESGGPRVRTYATDGVPGFDFFAYEPRFTGGVRVATGDVTGDAYDDYITAPGFGGGPRVRVFDSITGEVRRDFFAFEPSFRGGATVAARDLDGDGNAEILVGAGRGGGPRVRIYDGKTGNLKLDFFAGDPADRHGVTVAVGNSATGPTIAVGMLVGGGTVRTFDSSGQPLGNVSAYESSDGVSIACADTTGDTRPELLVGSGPGSVPQLKSFTVDKGTVTLLADIAVPHAAADRGGLRVGASSTITGRSLFVTAMDGTIDGRTSDGDIGTDNPFGSDYHGGIWVS